jgi:hypothetical protein
MRTIPNSGHIIASSTVRKKPGEKRSPVEEKTRRHLSSDGRWLRIDRTSIVDATATSKDP